MVERLVERDGGGQGLAALLADLVVGQTQLLQALAVLHQLRARGGGCLGVVSCRLERG